MAYLVQLDKALFNFINATLHFPPLFWIFEFITNLGDLIIVGVLFYLFILPRIVKMSSPKGLWWVMAVMLAAVGIAEGLVLLGKVAIHRPPPVSLIRKPLPEISIPFARYAFPSGHTARVFAATTVLWGKFPRWKIWLVVFALLVGFSRVYVGAHYPADVVSGAIVGGLVSAVLLRYEGKLREMLSKLSGRSIQDH
ncbi:MAG: phosphatase PAP2 family protein [Actinomycetota bacterium]|nr:phosphatase PAP2 family protein [Actinomycetota bacterium]